jgi:hypothetical protein
LALSGLDQNMVVQMQILAWILSNWRIILSVIAFIGSVYVYADHHGYSTGKKECETAAEKDRTERQANADAKSAELEKELADQRGRNKVLSKKLGDEIAKNSVYSTCVLPDDGVRLLREAIAGKPSSQR